jgi:hypothetical protein
MSLQHGCNQHGCNLRAVSGLGIESLPAIRYRINKTTPWTTSQCISTVT